MKSEYRVYGRDSEGLACQLTKRDEELLEGYLKFCATTAGPTKVKDYHRYMLQFRDVLEKPYDKITKGDAIEFWAIVNHSQHEPPTKAMIRRTVKRFLKWHFCDLEMLDALRNPGMPLVNPRKINKSVLFTTDEIKRMLHAADRPRDKAVLMILAETAARPQEVRDLRWNDVNWESREVHLHSTKTGRGRDLPIIHSVTHLKDWYDHWVYPDPQGNDFIFPALLRANQPRQKPLAASYLNRIIQNLARKAGIDRLVNAYLLRHSRLTELYKLGVKGIEHNKFAGHTPGSKHQNVYVHLDNEDLKQSLLKNVYGESEEKSQSNQSEITAETLIQMQVMHQKQVAMLQHQLLQMQQQIMKANMPTTQYQENTQHNLKYSDLGCAITSHESRD